jgi:signal transduction histidine kinase
MLVLSIIFRWQAVILMIASGMLVAVVLFKSYTGIEELSMVATDLEFKILYSLFLFSGILIAFLKPLQQDSEKQFKLFTETQEQMKEMSEQIINLLIMKQEFINNINHDIRIPIHNIGSSIYLLRYDWDKLLEEEKRENISIIYQGYKNISSYMNNILDLSDLSNNKMPLTYTKINFLTLTEKIIQSCKDLYLKDPDNIQLIITNHTQNTSVLCDEKKISQVIKHLIKNAIEYTNNGVIEVILSNEIFNSDRGKNLQGLKFSVVDEGIGVPENEVLHIFGPFIKSSYTKKKTRNAGIGLALAEKIIKIHQGIIWVSNNIDKKGATFSFIIPIR